MSTHLEKLIQITNATASALEAAIEFREHVRKGSSPEAIAHWGTVFDARLGLLHVHLGMKI